tara:strand:+ start:713 stop:1009 length:297 start_codon:yes stop_codon:yes gene_type:complete
MLTGQGDLATTSVYDSGLGVTSMAVSGASEISLADITRNPGLALSEMGKNLQANIVPMAVASLVTGVSFRFGKRLLRRPIGNINRNLVKPMLGAGIRL